MKEDNILVVTTENIPGYQIDQVLGEVFGQTTRSRNVISDFGQSFKAMVGGEIKGYTKLQTTARQEALARMQKEAANLGGNAVIMFRFDSNTSSLGDSVNAYGTAVKISPLSV